MYPDFNGFTDKDVNLLLFPSGKKQLCGGQRLPKSCVLLTEKEDLFPAKFDSV